jgi:small-conductance mechanosensitive channel
MDILAFLDGLPPAARVAAVLAGAVVLGLVAYAAIFRGAERLGRRAPALYVFDGALLRRTRRPTRMLFPLLAVRWSLPLLAGPLAPRTLAVVEDLLYVLLVGAVARVLVALTGVLDDVTAQRLEAAGTDNLRARAVRTEVGVLRRVLVIVIAVVAFVTAMGRFERFEGLGTGLVASAGVLGIVISIAAQRPLGNLVAGIQLALAQPIRVGDSVVVENEWGTVEEITLTYVVVRIWDARRLVLPISHFFERPFQNWTRTTAQIVGTVFLYVDYAAPVDDIRRECERVVRASPLWDGQVFALQVTDATDRALQLRAIMSSRNASQSWDLRCEVREKLVDYVRRAHPGALPRVRVAGRRGRAGAAADGGAARGAAVGGAAAGGAAAGGAATA